MIMRTLALLICAIILLAACKKDGPKPEELALQAAKVYYDQLLHGDYNAFVEGSLHGDSVAPSYKEQLLLNMKMYMERQQKEHQGIHSIEPMRAVADTAARTADAFLAITYNDSTREEILVPMVLKDGVWYLR